jgi:hypothetical protein
MRPIIHAGNEVIVPSRARRSLSSGGATPTAGRRDTATRHLEARDAAKRASGK